MAYRLEGTYLESCNCDVACPCGASNLVLPATNERCQVLLAFHIDEGDVDGVEVADTTVAMLADTPAQMSDGGWRVGLFLDEAASDEQREKLGAVFGGAQGGPPALFASLLGEMLGVEVTPIEFRDDGRRHTVRIGDAADIEIEDFAGAEEGSVMELHGSMHPANSTLALAQGIRSRIEAFGMAFDNTGRNGHSAPFSWQA
ncbi:MAG: hypothetical protein QOF29_2445 [bacterium]|jgi:hypothetical protein